MAASILLEMQKPTLADYELKDTGDVVMKLIKSGFLFSKDRFQLKAFTFMAAMLAGASAQAAPIAYDVVSTASDVSAVYFMIYDRPGVLTLDLDTGLFSGQFDTDPSDKNVYFKLIQSGAGVYDPATFTFTGNGYIGHYFRPAACGRNSCPEMPPASFHLVIQFDDASLQSFHHVPGSSWAGIPAWEFKMSGIQAVPVPPSAFLFGSALLGMAGAASRRRKAVVVN
jgi:hypothetical protein